MTTNDARGGWPPALWRRHYMPGFESCRVRPVGDGWEVAGAAVLNAEGAACRLDYVIALNSVWVSRLALVTGWVVSRAIDVEVERDSVGR